MANSGIFQSGTGAMSNEQSDAKVIPFPRQLRVVPIENAACAAPARTDVVPAVVEHDGHMYDLATLLQGLPPHCIRKVEASAPRSGQELWDEMVRRWPGTAAEAIAGVDKED